MKNALNIQIHAYSLIFFFHASLLKKDWDMKEKGVIYHRSANLAGRRPLFQPPAPYFDRRLHN